MEENKLKSFGVSAMGTKEIAITSGGWLPAAIAVAGAAIYLYNNWDDFVAGFENGQRDYNS